MRNIDDLRQALAAESAGVVIQVSPERVRRRARAVRTRRNATVVGLLAVVAMAVPGVLLVGRPILAPGSGASCPTSAATGEPDAKPSGEPGTQLDQSIGTGVLIPVPERHTQVEVVIKLVGTVQQPAFVVGFCDLNDSAVRWPTTIMYLARAPDGTISGKYDSDPHFRFFSSQVALGPDDVLDAGVYAGSAGRVTVTSEGRESDAATAHSDASGWTLFWVRRVAAPLPPGYNSTPVTYTGPEVLTLTAYDGSGRVQDTVTGGFLVGNQVQDPRDNLPR
jgi:hypothetical protein